MKQKNSQAINNILSQASPKYYRAPIYSKQTSAQELVRSAPGRSFAEKFHDKAYKMARPYSEKVASGVATYDKYANRGRSYIKGMGFDGKKVSRKMPVYMNTKVSKKITSGASRLAGALMPQDIMQQDNGSGQSNQPGRGRGRPYGTYTYQIPGVGPVPIQAFKRYQSQMKAQMRLQNELAKARMSMPMNEDPRYSQYPDAEDQWASQPDMNAQMQFQQRQQMEMMQQQMPQQPQQGFVNKASNFINRMGNTVQNMMGGQQQMQRPPMSPGVGPSQSMRLWGNGVGLNPQRNILNAPSIFNNPGQTSILFKNNERRY